MPRHFLREVNLLKSPLKPIRTSYLGSWTHWYWWRSQFSCSGSHTFKLRMSIVFDFATNTTFSVPACCASRCVLYYNEEKLFPWSGDVAMGSSPFFPLP